MLQAGYPKDIIDFGHGMPAQSIETAVWWEDVAKTYFFKGDRWVRMGAEHCPYKTHISKCCLFIHVAALDHSKLHLSSHCILNIFCYSQSQIDLSQNCRHSCSSQIIMSLTSLTFHRSGICAVLITFLQSSSPLKENTVDIIFLLLTNPVMEKKKTHNECFLLTALV